MLSPAWPLLLFICIVSADLKVWQWSNDFDNPSHWMAGRSPCPGQDVKIPAEIVFMPKVMVMGSIDLAVGGMLVLSKNSSLNLLSQPLHGSKPPPGCLLANHPAIYKPPPHGAWLDPSNWTPPGPSPHPHTHQVPCHHDHAVFPTDMTYKMSVLDSDVTVAQLSINGRALDSGSLRSVFKSDVGRKMFNVTKSVRITERQCMEPSGCLCGTEDLETEICRYAGLSCPYSTCSSPLKPSGHCCWNFCGAIVHISTSTAWSVHMSTLTAIAKDHAGDHTHHYVRKVGEEKYEVLLVPKKTGNLTTTADAASNLSNYLLVELKAATVWVEYSGTSPPPSALAKTGTAIGWIILIALMAGTGLFVYTKSSGRPLSMPNLRSASVHLPTPVWRQEDLSALRRRAEAPFSGFARFKNMGEGDGVVQIEGLDKGVVEMGTDMMILKPDDLKTDEDDIARSFSNPMFNVEPPSNIYSAEPTEDMTYGVDNPTYVALNEMKMDKKR